MSASRAGNPTTSLPYRLVTGVIGAVSLTAALVVGVRPTGPVPPLGTLLDPVHGVWALAGHAEHPRIAAGAIASLTGPVDVRYDDRGVAHIFASNELDALRAQGYVVARDRLFQLELQTRAAAGTLTELVGARALEADRATRRAGLPWGAQRKLDLIEQDPATMAVLQAYADGVNAYIRTVRTADLPLEYRLLGRRPQEWQPLHTMLLLVRMGQTLAWSDFELARATIEARIGRAATDALFPVDSWLQEPIQPNGAAEPQMRNGVIPAPTPDTTRRTAQRAQLAQALRPLLDASRVEHDGVLGSNNWAVAPSRSASGNAILANDPHLELSLPSIWYEVHLVVADSLDAYGVTFPGAPGIILGLNRHIAWGTTNVGADVMDYYLEVVDDTLAPTRYQLDGTWEPLDVREELYRDARGGIVERDTSYYTHRGPLLKVNGQWISRRWTVLEPSKDFEAFRMAMKARSVDEYFMAMSTFAAPAQNLLVADQQGNIGIRSTAQYPIRPGDGRGDHFFDGSTRASDWLGFRGPEAAPQTRNPAQGFIASANQQPADPAQYDFYLGNEWPAPWRALHINTLLRADSSVTADDMRGFQTDAGNARAARFVPLFIEASGTRSTGGTGGDSTLSVAVKLLGEWDRRFDPGNEVAVLFEAAMRQLGLHTWDEFRADSAAGADVPTALMASPNEDALYALMRDPSNVWWDRVGTPARETRDDILAAALVRGYESVVRDRGPRSEGGWRWDKIRFANIWHPLRLPALSALNLPVQGGRESLNPSSGNGTHGASWRLVAEVGPTINARAIYPGGQSANPVSPHFRDRIETWRTGQLDSLRIPAAPGALTPAHHRATLLLSATR
jgi:penicillin amidase